MKLIIMHDCLIIIIIIDPFYLVLFSALEHTHTVLEIFQCKLGHLSVSIIHPRGPQVL